MPINTIPSVEQGADTTGNDEADATLGNKTERTFSKSLSTSSISSVSCPASELLSNMDGQLCQLALEHLLMLVASQGICVIRSTVLEPRWKQIVRREISNELMIYHEFVRRKVVVDYRDQKNPCQRRKQGIYKLKFSDPARGYAMPSSSRSTDVVRRSSSTSNELRVNVVRRQHLQQQLRTPPPNRFDMSHDLSPISTGSQNAARGSPESRKRLYPSTQMGESFVEDELAAIELQFFPPPSDRGFCEQSQVQLVEEDYLHVMSCLFNAMPHCD